MNNCSGRRTGDVNPRRYLQNRSYSNYDTNTRYGDNNCGCENTARYAEGSCSCNNARYNADTCGCNNAGYAGDIRYNADNSCGGCNIECNCIDYSLAMLYPRSQNFACVYDSESGMAHGTIFKELYKPFEGESVMGCKK
jgi:hypothetical protein